MTVSIPGKETPMESFMEKVKIKVRDDIASMIPDDVIQNLIQQVVKDEFFKKNKVNVGTNWNPVWEERPTEFQKLVLEAVRPIMNERAQKFLESNKEEIDELIKEVLNNGLMNIVENSIKTYLQKQIVDNSHWFSGDPSKPSF